MTHAIETGFRDRKQAQAAARRRARLKKALAAAAAAAVLAAGVGFYLTRSEWSFSDADQDLVPVEASDQVPADAPVYVPAIVDLAGDPMWISLAQDGGAQSHVRAVARPADLAQAGISPEVRVLSDTMLNASERFMTAIPATQEDFAFFQAQRAAAAPADAAAQAGSSEAPPAADALQDAAPGAQPAADTTGAGWGETIDAGQAALPDFKKTAVENNTTVAVVTPEGDRFQATQDFFVKVLARRSLDGIALDNHFSPEDAKAAGAALKALFNRDAVEPGFVVALRGFRPSRDAPVMTLMQVSVYTSEAFVGTMARDGAGAFVVGADPWVSDDLFHYSVEPGAGGPKRQFRLLDAIYSTAARNDVPTGVIGEAIMLLSRGEDLSAFAAEGDRFVLAYSDTARGKDGVSGRVLYAGVEGGAKTLRCFVFAQGDGQFACVSQSDQVRSVTVVNGMVTPVNGVMTSTFGPQLHPILKTVRNNKGVDWAAPVGTPVFAAFDGQVTFQGESGDYGNLVRIAHGNGRETTYSHLQGFASGRGVGAAVKAGDVIGYVGASGVATGPGLHFELRQNGEAVDPLATAAAAVEASASPSSDDAAVEILTDRIIRVESGGSARAKNPLSSATGLGQFIDSTWIRMIGTYRPDLAHSLSRAQILDLRYDPTISREMVRDLAREGEAYLRARGHQITAGRLYLCHFLGMQGAAVVLSAAGGAALVDVLGPGVIRANPFLTGKTVSYVITWAEAKMQGRAPPAAAAHAEPVTRVVKEASPEFDLFKAAVTALLQASQALP